MWQLIQIYTDTWHLFQLLNNFEPIVLIYYAPSLACRYSCREKTSGGEDSEVSVLILQDAQLGK